MIIKMLKNRRGRGPVMPQGYDYVKGQTYSSPGEIPHDVAEIFLSEKCAEVCRMPAAEKEAKGTKTKERKGAKTKAR